VDAIAQDGNGQAGFVGIERDEGAEGVERDADGQAGIAEGDLGDGEFAGESCAFEAAEAGRVLGAEAIGTFVGRHEAGFEDVGDGLAAAGLRPDGGEGVLGRAALIGAVEDFPIAKLAASAEADAAGGDTAEGHGEHGKLASGVDAGIAHGGAREGDGLRRVRGWRRPAREGRGWLAEGFARRRLRGARAGQRDGFEESAAAGGLAHLV
jgi:hypothetical protein